MIEGLNPCKAHNPQPGRRSEPARRRGDPHNPRNRAEIDPAGLRNVRVDNPRYPQMRPEQVCGFASAPMLDDTNVCGYAGNSRTPARPIGARAVTWTADNRPRSETLGQADSVMVPKARTPQLKNARRTTPGTPFEGASRASFSVCEGDRMEKTQDTLAPRWLRPDTWQQLTGMSHGQTYRALWSGELRAVQIGKAWYIRESEIEDYFARNGKAAA